MGKLKAVSVSSSMGGSSEWSSVSECVPRRMIVNLDQIPWKYRAEGNANLVLALPDTRQVLRLKKVDVVAPGDLRGDANENFQYLKTVVDYIKEISSLLLEDFVIDPQLVILLLKDIDLFNKQLSQYRPGEDDYWDDQKHNN